MAMPIATFGVRSSPCHNERICRVDAQRGVAVDAQGFVEAGNQHQQPDGRTCGNVAQRIEQVVATQIGDDEMVIVEHFDEPGWPATR